MNKENISQQTKNATGPFKYLQKPYLLTRMAAAFLDLLLVLILFAVIETTFYYTLFHQLGYHQTLTETRQFLFDSHLYIQGSNNEALTITDAYNENLSLEENYEVPIIYYYSTNERAILNSRLNNYLISKENSGYFVFDEDENLIRKDGISEDKFKDFYVSAYNRAVTFLEDDPIYTSGVQKTFFIVLFTSLGSVTIGSLLIYLIIPLIAKNGQTPFKFVFKLCLVDGRDETRVKKWQILVRYFILVFFNIWVPIVLYARFIYMTIIPIIVSIIMLFVTKSNSAPHDFIAKVYVVSKRDVNIPLTREQPIIDHEERF